MPRLGHFDQMIVLLVGILVQVQALKANPRSKILAYVRIGGSGSRSCQARSTAAGKVVSGTRLNLRPDAANDQLRETMWRSSQLNFRSDEDSNYENKRSDLQVADDAVKSRGWSILSETLNGRLASAGLIIGLFREEITGHSLLQQLQDDEFPLVFVASFVSLLTLINYSSWVQRRIRQQNLPLL